MKFSLQKLVTGMFLVAAALNAGTALGSGSHEGGHGHGFSFGEPGKGSQVDRTIRITARDTEFDVDRIHVHEGETIRFIVTNEGELDHDFTIGPAAVQEQHRQEMMEMMNGGEAMTDMHHDPNAVYVKPGETKQLVWTFTGIHELEFACNVPGHYEAGMKGVIASEGGHH